MLEIQEWLFQISTGEMLVSYLCVLSHVGVQAVSVQNCQHTFSPASLPIDCKVNSHLLHLISFILFVWLAYIKIPHGFLCGKGNITYCQNCQVLPIGPRIMLFIALLLRSNLSGLSESSVFSITNCHMHFLTHTSVYPHMILWDSTFLFPTIPFTTNVLSQVPQSTSRLDAELW